MDTPREWLEVSGPTVDVAVKAALDELGLDSPEQVNVEVIQEGKRGVLGLGGREAIVKVSRRPRKRRRRRRRRESGTGTSTETAAPTNQQRQKSGDRKGRQPQKSAQAGRAKQDKSRADDGTRSEGRKRNAGSGQPRDRRSNDGGGKKKAETRDAGAPKDATKEEPMATADISEQADVAREFLEGLLDAFGLEGEVTSRIDDDILYLDVSGEQTEALVGSRGAIMTSVLEITRTVVQRTTFGAPRMRLDIAGYAERRRAALVIYAGKLADQVKEQGDEIMLEPMNPADRKVVHDAVGDIDGVRSFSEGEDPHRAVVIAPE